MTSRGPADKAWFFLLFAVAVALVATPLVSIGNGDHLVAGVPATWVWFATVWLGSVAGALVLAEA